MPASKQHKSKQHSKHIQKSKEKKTKKNALKSQGKYVEKRPRQTAELQRAIEQKLNLEIKETSKVEENPKELPKPPMAPPTGVPQAMANMVHDAECQASIMESTVKEDKDA